MCMCVHLYLSLTYFLTLLLILNFFFYSHFLLHFFNDRSLCIIQKTQDSVKKEKPFFSPDALILVKYEVFISVHNKRMYGFGTAQSKKRS